MNDSGKIEADARLLAIRRHMRSVQAYRQDLRGLQSTWDSLTLLGQLSGVGASMTTTQEAFAQLTDDLLHHLGREVLRKTVRELTAKAQVAIDVLVRNLFERTADIGFLATDADLCGFARASAGSDAVRDRLRAYRAKYTVYADVVMFDPDGRVLVRLGEGVATDQGGDPIVDVALNTSQPYVESYRQHSFLPGGESLCYASRMVDGDEVLGVLVLCFQLANEMERIFGGLLDASDWTVICLLDEGGRVLASSDAVQAPAGVRLARAQGAWSVVRHGGREYLAVACEAQGYQGYKGPGWRVQAMLPVEHAFEVDVGDRLSGLDQKGLAAARHSASLFDRALQQIPVQAENIQAELNRSVWNGSLRVASDRSQDDGAFAKVLLREISRTGSRMQEVFEQSIADLQQTVLESVLGENRLLATLAIDIMDRNLYERANDARWWALTSSLRACLADVDAVEDAQAIMGPTLAYINGLYTVYDNIVVFDAQGRVRAMSNPHRCPTVAGEVLREEWVPRVLALRDEQAYVVSAYEATPLYQGRRTYVYGAAIHAPEVSGHGDARAVGGIALVFDAGPQFSAMLRDALPRNVDGEIVEGAFGVFLDHGGQVIACSDDRLAVGECVPMASAMLKLARGASKAVLLPSAGKVCAAGAAMSRGYREFKGPDDRYRNDVLAMVFQPLCDVATQVAEAVTPGLALESDAPGDGARVDIASLRVGSTWFAVRAECIVEALPPARLAQRPSVGGTFLGYVIHQGSAVAVQDVATLVHAPGWYTQGRQVVVLRRPGAQGRFGIVVDGLGDIVSVTSARLQACPPHTRGSHPVADAIVKLEGDKPLLLLLDIEQLAVCLGAAVASAGHAEKTAPILSASPRQV